MTRGLNCRRLARAEPLTRPTRRHRGARRVAAVGGRPLAGTGRLEAPRCRARGGAPEVVLDAYFGALVAGDCDTGRKLATATLVYGNGDLCGATRVSAYEINSVPARPNAAEVVFSTTVTTTGTADGSIHPGAMTWFYSLDKQPDGSWRLVGGGSGP